MELLRTPGSPTLVGFGRSDKPALVSDYRRQRLPAGRPG